VLESGRERVPPERADRNLDSGIVCTDDVIGLGHVTAMTMSIARIVLTSRADSVRSRMASCAVAVLYAHFAQQQFKARHVS
jgi:hypothetical protein